MKRSEIIHRFWGGVLTACLVIASSQVVRAQANQPDQNDLPNVILCMGDDHGWDETGYNGHPYVKTPVLDEMARTGLCLNRFYSGHPSCSPTRGSFITGRHPNRYGTFAPNWSIRPEEISIAHIMSKAGYQCAHFGKWHLGPVKADSPTNPGALGFHEWLSHDNFFEIDPVLSRNGAKPEKLEGESSEVIIREAIEFIKRCNAKQKPFFVVVWFGSPHEPYAGLPADLKLYDDLPAKHADKKVPLTSIKTGKPTKRALGDVLRERLAEITAMDRSIGQLRNFLKQTKQRENSMLWYCGDNGTPRSGVVAVPFRGQKGVIYEGGVRVPGVIEWPARIKTARKSDVNVVTSDILPTLCSLVGQPVPDRPLDGIDLTDLLDGTMESRATPVCFWMYDTAQESRLYKNPYIRAELQEGTTPLVKMMAGKYTRTFRNVHHPTIQSTNYNGARSILGNKFKLVVDGIRGKTELFDIQSDPGEKKNLAADHPEVVKRMSAELKEWQTSVLTSLTGADY